MKWLDRSIDRPLPVFLAAVVVASIGVFCLLSLPVKRSPTIEIPYALVVGAYIGATPDEVEAEITVPLEEDLATLPGLRHMTSISSEGVSTTILEFVDRADMRESLRDVRDRIDLAAVDLPKDSESVVVKELSFEDEPIAIFTLTGGQDPYRLRELAESLELDFETLPGVRSVEIFGGSEVEVHIEPDPLALARHELTLGDVALAVRHQSDAIPAGRLRGTAVERLIRATGEFRSLEEIRGIPVSADEEGALQVRDVAEVTLSHKRIGTGAWLDGVPSVSLLVLRRSDVNTLETARGLRARAEAMRPELPPGIQLTVTGDASTEIDEMIGQLGTSAAVGVTFVVIVLFVMFGAQQALLVSTVLPFALLFTFIGLRVFDMEISNIALFALILVLGLVVDGAIVVGEAIYSEREQGAKPRDAAKMAIARVGAPVIAADLTTIAAFLPMLLMVGVMGQFMSVMPKVVVFALVGSVFVDHLLLPAASARFPNREEGKRRMPIAPDGLPWFSPALPRIRSLYRRVLAAALARKAWVVGGSGVAIACALGLLASGLIPSVFLPGTDRSQVTVEYSLSPGQTLDETGRVGLLLTRDVLELPEVDRVLLTTGDTGALNTRAGQSGRVGPEYGKLAVELVAPDERERSQGEVAELMRSRLAYYAGVDVTVSELQEGPPVGPALTLLFQGNDFDELNGVARSAAAEIESIAGLRDVRVNYEQDVPQLRVDLDRSRSAAQYGVGPDRVAQALRLAFEGEDVGRMWVAGERVDVRLQAPRVYADSVLHVGELPIRVSDGALVPLSELASVRTDFSHDAVFHRDGLRTVTLRAEAAVGASSVQLEEDVRAVLARSNLPPGIRVEFAGESEERDRSNESLWRALKWGALLIYCIIAVQFNSLRQPLIVLVTVPLALVGVTAGLLVTGHVFSFMVFIGIVALTGIVVNDGIVLIDSINRNRRAGMALEDAVQSAAISRMRPVLLTTVTTIAGLLPLTLGVATGAEFWVPLGVTIISGLLVASMLTLIVMPVLYAIVESDRVLARRAPARAKTPRPSAPPELDGEAVRAAGS